MLQKIPGSHLPPKPMSKKNEDSRDYKEPGARLRRIGQEILDSGRPNRSSSMNRWCVLMKYKLKVSVHIKELISKVFRIVSCNIFKNPNCLFKLFNFCDFVLISFINNDYSCKYLAFNKLLAGFNWKLYFLDYSLQMVWLFWIRLDLIQLFYLVILSFHNFPRWVLVNN